MRALALAACLLVSGCTPIRYVTQAAAGQERLNQRGITIAEIVDNHYLDRRTRDLLAQVPHIKAFGERHGLKKTSNYERYVWLGKSAVVWVVSACDPLRFRPRAWSFPIIGSITYTGWFDRTEATAYAAELTAKGYDVDVRSSQAYSTLGWFDDPILSTMIAPGPEAIADLADVVLHETFHATYYVPGQSTLNESVASFYGHNLAMAYLDETLGPDSQAKATFLEAREKGEARGRAMHAAYIALDTLYKSRASRADKLAEKKRITETLRSEVGIRRPVTNATLIQYKTYGSGQSELDALLRACSGDFTKMLGALERVRVVARTARPHTDPGELIRPILAEGGC